jgi:hypothetical protein
MSESSGGPYLAMALLCERILQEKDGVLSIIRVIDRVQIQGTADEMPPVSFNVSLVVALKAGIARGKYLVKVVPVSPSGKQLNAAELPALLEGEDRGANLVFQMQIVAYEEGLYWFDVYVQDTFTTRVPLRFLYQKVATGASPS